MLTGLNAGGTENGVVNLVNRAAPDLIRSSICTLGQGQSMRGRVAPEVVVVDVPKPPGRGWRQTLGVASVLRRLRPDVVHTHLWGTVLEGIVGARLAGVPIVIHGEHGDIVKRSWRDAALQRFLWHRAHQLLSVSEVLRRELASEIGYPAERVKVIRNGVDLTRFSAGSGAAVARRRLGIGDSLLVGTVGHLAKVKGYDLLVRAFALVARRHDARLLIVGEGEEQATLEDEARRAGVADRVSLTGKREDVAELLRALDLFVLSSHHEGMPNAVMEAMACARAVVATRVGGVPELVVDGETGVLVPPGDEERLARAIEELLLDPARRSRLGAAGRTRMEQSFALDRMVGEYVDTYLDLADRYLARTR